MPGYLDGSDEAAISAFKLAGDADGSCYSDAEGERTDRLVHPLPQGGSAVNRQADRAGSQLRRPGGDRHREHAAAQRVAAVAGAADCDGRGVARHQLARPAIWCRCFNRCCRMRCASAKPISAILLLRMRTARFAIVAMHGTPPAFAEHAASRAVWSNANPPIDRWARGRHETVESTSSTSQRRPRYIEARSGRSQPVELAGAQNRSRRSDAQGRPRSSAP